MKLYKLTIITIMLTLAFSPFLNPLEVEAAGESTFVKIGLKYGSSSSQTCSLKSDTGFFLGTVSETGFAEGMPLPAYTTIIASVENGSVTLKDENGTLLSAQLGPSGCIMPNNYLTGGIISADNSPYRDGIILLPNSNGTMTVINYLSLEHYVYGVLNAELHNSNPEEALKAQAVAARSFGALNLGKHKTDGFDLCATTHCQMYKGYSGEFPSTNKAADDTRGEMIYSQGKPVNAFYFKNSGGYTQNVEDVWSYSATYLKSVKDIYSPNYPWSVSLSFDMIKQKLEAAGYNPGQVQSISITGRNSTGSVSELLISGSNNQVRLSKEKIRNVLGTTVIKSLMFSLADSSTGQQSKGFTLYNGSKAADIGTDIYVISGSNKITKLQTNGVFGSNGQAPFKLSSQSSSETASGQTATFTGTGYGHGVGMPQDSAIQMAKQGFTYKQILEYYYTGIEVK